MTGRRRRSPAAAAVLLASCVLLVAPSALADDTIQHPGDHPRYALEAEPLFVRERPYRLGQSGFCDVRLNDALPGEEPVALEVSTAGARVTNTGHRLPVQVGSAPLAPGEVCGWSRGDLMQVGENVFALWCVAQDAIDEYQATE